METIKVGYYIKPFESSFKEVSLSTVLKSFGNDHFKAIVEPARRLYQNGEYEEYTVYKNKLPAVTFSGTFTPKRTIANIQKYSAIVILDMDRVGNDLLTYKKYLSKDPYVIAVWLSPSGDGLKFIISSSESELNHKGIYNSAHQYFRDKYDMEIDKSGSDISRLCFVSCDPDIRINPQYISFDKYNLEEYKNTIPEKKKTTTELVAFIPTENNDQALSKQTYKKIFHYLSKRNLSITDNYENWIRVAFAIRNTFSYNIGYEYFMGLCQLDGPYHDEEASDHLINSCYKKASTKSSFGTIVYLCKQKGFVVDFNKKMNKRKV